METEEIENSDENTSQESLKIEPIATELRAGILGFEFNIGMQSYGEKKTKKSIQPNKNSQYIVTPDPSGNGSWVSPAGSTTINY